MIRAPAAAAAADLTAAIAAAARAGGLAPDPRREGLLAAYVELVFKWQRVMNLTAAHSRIDFASRHVADCLAVLPHVRGPFVVDAGSGNGLPGVVLAIAEPAWRVHLVDARQKRTRFLEQVRIELALPNLAVSCARLEAWTPPGPPDTVICRAYGSLERFIADSARLHHAGCRLLAMKGQPPDDELAALGPAAAACSTVPLAVPGWTERHLVIVDCARLVPYSHPNRQS